MDEELADAAHKIFAKQGLKFKLGARVTGAKARGEECTLEVEGEPPWKCDRVLVSVGRKPNTVGLAPGGCGGRVGTTAAG